MLVPYLILVVPLSIAVGILANRYNRSPVGWFLLSALLSPLIGFAFVAALGPAPKVESHPVRPITKGERLAGNTAIVALALLIIGLLVSINTHSPAGTQDFVSTYTQAKTVSARKTDSRIRVPGPR